MKIFIKVKPTSREESIEKIDEDKYLVSVKESPVQGRANNAVIKALAEYFQVAPSQVAIVSGQTSRAKIVEINDSTG